MWEQLVPWLPFIIGGILIVWFVAVRVFDQDDEPIWNLPPFGSSPSSTDSQQTIPRKQTSPENASA